MTNEMKITGTGDLKRVLSALSGPQLITAVRAPMTAVGTNILTAAKRQTPRDTGALVNSASMDVATSLNTIDVTLGYNTPYAEPVHERDLNYRVGNWKYLQTPIEQATGAIWNQVAQGVEAWLRRIA